MKRRGSFEGWILVGWTALVVAAMSGLILAVNGFTPDGLRMLIRATARTSFVLFTAAFIASSAVQLWPLPITKWLRRNRRYLGVSFGTSHAAHLLAIVSAARVIPDFEIDTLTLLAGGGAYVLIAAMTITSFDRTASWLGRSSWLRLHKVGVYYLWGIFAFDYIGRAVVMAEFIPFAIVVLGSLGLRLAAARRQVGAPSMDGSASAATARLRRTLSE